MGWDVWEGVVDGDQEGGGVVVSGGWAMRMWRCLIIGLEVSSGWAVGGCGDGRYVSSGHGFWYVGGRERKRV